MNLLSELIDVIYPPRCPVCQTFTHKDEAAGALPFCSRCRADFREITSPMCSVCGMPISGELDADHPCEDCIRRRPHFAAARAPYYYDGALMVAIHLFKYAEKIFLGKILGNLLAQFAAAWVPQTDGLLTMPVPLHPGKLRARGVNQSLLLARPVAAVLQTELDFLALRRVRYTRPQIELRKPQRRRNVRGAFEVRRPDKILKRPILLVDDVATTGNTLNECARVLRRAGAGKVLGLVLARPAR